MSVKEKIVLTGKNFGRRAVGLGPAVDFKRDVERTARHRRVSEQVAQKMALGARLKALETQLLRGKVGLDSPEIKAAQGAIRELFGRDGVKELEKLVKEGYFRPVFAHGENLSNSGEVSWAESVFRAMYAQKLHSRFVTDPKAARDRQLRFEALMSHKARVDDLIEYRVMAERVLDRLGRDPDLAAAADLTRLPDEVKADLGALRFSLSGLEDCLRDFKRALRSEIAAENLKEDGLEHTAWTALYLLDYFVIYRPIWMLLGALLFKGPVGLGSRFAKEVKILGTRLKAHTLPLVRDLGATLSMGGFNAMDKAAVALHRKI